MKLILLYLNGLITTLITNETIYVNKEKYNQKLALYRRTCELLLACSTYFTVNKLYKKKFLLDHNIRFGEDIYI